MKILAAVSNAKGLLRVRDEFESFDKYLWRLVHGTHLQLLNCNWKLSDVKGAERNYR